MPNKKLATSHLMDGFLVMAFDSFGFLSYNSQSQELQA